MAEKTYKYVSICQRDKPIQTNNPSTFIQHVASCPTCKSNLPASVIQTLQPRLDQIIREKKGVETTEEQEPDQPDLQGQFDRHLGDSPVFQGVEKSVTETKVNVETLSQQVNGISEKISRDIASLGDTLIERMTGGSRGEKEVVDVDVGEPPEEEGKETPGKVLSAEEEKLQEKGGDVAGGEGRPNPFGSTDKVPAAMRKDYQPGKKVPPEEKVAGEESPPEGKEDPQGGQAPSKTPSPKGGKGLPDLDTPDEVEAVKLWLAKQEKKMEGAKKPETEKKGVVPYLGDLTDTVKAVKQVIDAWKGKGEGGGGEASFSQFAQELVLEMLKKQVASQVAPAPAAAGTISIVQMDAMRNLLGTFFSGLKSMPKEEATKLVQGLSETSSEVSETEETESPEQIR